ncbi:MAG: formate dehydrogenase accessory sulfurtransferase FdhD [Proteobacteria bacterium]|nr:MAG: formate dehydrogenase accessory sulfurtransferase FdhD [Pseudomonadota bacterium]
MGSALRRNIIRLNQGESQICSDLLAVEEPLEIRLDSKGREGRQQKSISITMRTPGHDYDLATGFLFTEGLIQSVNQIEKISHCGPVQPHLGHSNVVKVTLADDVTLDLDRLQRHFYTSSSCGVCGKSSIEALRTQSLFPKSVSSFEVTSALIQTLPDKLRQAQAIFDSTGGLHASALFDSSGRLQTLREDVGRHNALDKVLGHSIFELPLRESILMLSGRISFELVQKAVMARIPIIAAVGAPSSLAVELAESEDVTLIGFLRGERFNIYTGSQRILTGSHLL